MAMAKLNALFTDKHKEEQKIEEKEVKYYSFNQDNKYKLTWDVFMNSVYVVSFFMFPFCVAF